MLIEPLVPNSLTRVLVMVFVLLGRKIEFGIGKLVNKTGSLAICSIDINPVWFLSNTRAAYSKGKGTV